LKLPRAPLLGKERGSLFSSCRDAQALSQNSALQFASSRIAGLAPGTKRPSPKELDGDLGRNFLERFLNFVSGVGQPACVDVNSYVAAWTRHVVVCFQAPDCLLQIGPAIGALKPDFMQIDGHRGFL
jgi:hypothetical protein